MECYDYYYEEGTPSRMRPVPIWLCVFLVVTYILSGAVLFMQWERWQFLDSAYFCFITLTTIGFGDFVPAKRVQDMDAEVSIALCSLYLLFGIALLAMSFNLVQEEVINNVKSVAKRLGIVKDDTEEDDD
jgi:Ion channel.